MKDNSTEIGKRYGKWIVIDNADKRPKGDDCWLCRCDCGKEKIVLGYNLRSSHSSSCGCQTLKYKSNHPLWTGCGEIFGSYFNAIKLGAKNRELKFDITIIDIWELFLKQERKCALTGLNLLLPQTSKDTNATASLDRIDSSKGYIKNNIQWVHKDLNTMKMNLSQEQFINYCRLVVNCVDKKLSLI
jgi:hypothetical protein